MTLPAPQSPRLLSLLSLIEAALSEGTAVARAADYRKGLARMSFADGGSVAVQNFSMADGQLCLRLELRPAGAVKARETAIYPRPGTFDWSAEAERIAREWREVRMAGPNLVERAV
jgi:hypothetical protein